MLVNRSLASLERSRDHFYLVTRFVVEKSILTENGDIQGCYRSDPSSRQGQSS